MSPSTAAAPWERAAALLGCRARRELPLGPRSTYRVGGAARVGWSAETIEDLQALAAVVSATAVDVLVVGNGSNLLVADRGFDGVAVVLGEGFATVTIDGLRARAGGAAALPVVARRTAAAGLTGFEWAVGVPGSIGGAVRMNAGGHGSDMAACLASVSLLSLADPAPGPVTVDVADLDLRYRHSALRADQVVTEVSLALAPGDASRAEAAIAEIVRWRRANQPGGQNAGSVFTNPPGDSAGRLIDAAGGKGLRAGTAEVSTKHANFIQADAGGSADDVVVLMAEVRRRVLAAGGPALVPETRLVGFGVEVLAAVGAPSEARPDRAVRPDATGRRDRGEGGGS
jgi:UDP-N-acetylmuramate dehydrogenase